jgi:hypothetical protein
MLCAKMHKAFNANKISINGALKMRILFAPKNPHLALTNPYQDNDVLI